MNVMNTNVYTRYINLLDAYIPRAETQEEQVVQTEQALGGLALGSGYTVTHIYPEMAQTIVSYLNTSELLNIQATCKWFKHLTDFRVTQPQFLEHTVIKVGSGWNFLKACNAGDLKRLKLVYLYNRFDIKVKNYWHETGLYLAAQNGHTHIVEILLDFGLDVNSWSYGKISALSLSTRLGYVKMFTLLLDRGANPNTRDIYGNTPLSIAIKHGQAKMVHLLIKQGVNLQTLCDSSQSALHLAVKEGTFRIVKSIIDGGADINFKDRYNSTALHIAAKKRNLKIYNLLVDRGADIHARDIHGNTAVSYMPENKRVPIAKSLEARKIDVNDILKRVIFT